MASVLVLGATGQTGRRVVSLLRGAHALRVATRDPARARELLGADVEAVRADVRDRASLVGLTDGVDAVVSTVGSRTYFGANGGAMVDALGMQNLAAEAAEAGVGQLVLLSAFGLDRRSLFLSAFSAALNRYFHWKRLAELAVRESGVPYTIVRPVELREREPAAPALLNQSEPLSLLRTVSRAEVARVLVACVGNPEALGKTFEVCEREGAPSIDAQLRTMLGDERRPLPERTPLFGR